MLISGRVPTLYRAHQARASKGAGAYVYGPQALLWVDSWGLRGVLWVLWAAVKELKLGCQNEETMLFCMMYVSLLW